jgi:acyl-CoA reductase-like NAD-dependent aldehyde dehydrogenase
LIERGLYIDGEFVESLDGATLDVLNPHDGSVLAVVAEGGPDDIDRAVNVAQRAFESWSRTSSADRGRLLLRLADIIEDNAEEMAKLESVDTGHPIRDTTLLDVPRTVATFRYFGGMADKYEGYLPPADAGFLNYVTHEPIGVVGQIVPWNFPLMFCGWKWVQH